MTSVSVQLGDELFSMASGYLSYESDTLWAELPAWMLVHGDMIVYRLLSAVDIYGCTPDSFPAPGTLIVDLEPPEFHGFDPPSDTTIGIVPQIRLHIADTVSGIDHSSVYLQFDGAIIPPDDTRLLWEEDTVLRFTSRDTFPIGYPVIICLTEISDNAELCGPNVQTTLYSATYFVSNTSESGKSIPLPLLQAHPNPFNASCDIRISIRQKAQAKLTIYNLTGHEIAELYNGILTPGMHDFSWDAHNLSSGIYFAVADIGSQRIIKRIALIK